MMKNINPNLAISKSSLVKVTALTATLLLASACSEEKKSTDIPVTSVPANVIEIVQNTLPGIVLHEAEREEWKNQYVYELEGKLINGKEYEIKIAGDGTIIEVELED